MGTTLTGTTPQDTYDSLIKVTDNGPLSGSLKKLTDGLGNDSSLSLSTTAASFSGTLAVSGASTFSSAITMALGGTPRLTLQDTDGGAGNVGILFKESTSDKWTLASNGGAFQFFNEATASNALFISSTNNVGIGTSTPDTKLQVAGTGATGFSIRSNTSGDAFMRYYLDGVIASDAYVDRATGVLNIRSNQNGSAIAFSTSAALIERVRITDNGLTFNGDTAAANALDDYEEGTFTPTIIGSTTAGTATYGGGQAGTYTKIGNVVYFQIYLGYSGGTGTGDLRIAGLPFTVPANDLPSFTFGVFLNVALTALNVPIAGGIGSTNQIYINQIPTGGGSQTAVAYDDSAVIQISGFYRV